MERDGARGRGARMCRRYRTPGEHSSRWVLRSIECGESSSPGKRTLPIRQSGDALLRTKRVPRR